MIYLYVLIAMSASNPGNVHTVQYFSTHQECLIEKYRLEEMPERTYLYDCWIKRASND